MNHDCDGFLKKNGEILKNLEEFWKNSSSWLPCLLSVLICHLRYFVFDCLYVAGNVNCDWRTFFLKFHQWSVLVTGIFGKIQNDFFKKMLFNKSIESLRDLLAGYLVKSTKIYMSKNAILKASWWVNWYFELIFCLSVVDDW